jgi:hypothetical protein
MHLREKVAWEEVEGGWGGGHLLPNIQHLLIELLGVAHWKDCSVQKLELLNVVHGQIAEDASAEVGKERERECVCVREGGREGGREGDRETDRPCVVCKQPCSAHRCRSPHQHQVPGGGSQTLHTDIVVMLARISKRTG